MSTSAFLSRITMVAAWASTASAQISQIDIPFMAFYDHQGTYVASVPQGAPAGRALRAAATSNLSSHGTAVLPASALRFQRSARVTALVRDDVVERFTREAPGRTAQVRREFERADVVGEFRRLIAVYGYDPLDLSHAMAAFLILQWEVIEGATAQEHQMRGAASQLAQRLRATPAIGTMGDEDKQMTADALAYQAVMSVLLARDLQRRGDTIGLQRLRRGLIETNRNLGWDFARLRLTERGFVPAR